MSVVCGYHEKDTLLNGLLLPFHIPFQIKMFDDHIVVESPGKLPGLVRADNIRFTHFSRNPKIAEFLKNYKFVKEFGEGVNRMCNELEQVGLKDPVYHTNAFMLQAVIYNSKVGKTIVEKKLIH